MCIGVNKVDCHTAGYKERHYEISNKMMSMLVKVGWRKRFYREEHARTSHFWLYGSFGESENMAVWKGAKVFVDAEEFRLDTLRSVGPCL